MDKLDTQYELKGVSCAGKIILHTQATHPSEQGMDIGEESRGLRGLEGD